MQWMTIKQMAQKRGCTISRIYQLINKGKILKRKVGNGVKVAYPESENISAQIEQTAEEKALAQTLVKGKNIQNELKQEKLNNLRQDTLLKKQKNTLTKQLYRVEYAEGVLQCFSSAFANVKNLLIDLKLTAEQNQNFQSAFRKALKRFEENLTNYLAQKDKDEEKALADENTKEN